MSRIFNIVVVDDNPETLEYVLQAIKMQLKIKYNYDISYVLLSKRKEVEQLNEHACDIVMFDCELYFIQVLLILKEKVLLIFRLWNLYKLSMN